MRMAMLRFCYFLLLLSSLAVRAQDPPPDLAAIVGTYRGQALNGGSLDPVVTVFRFGPGGRLTGEYTIEDETGTFHGTISNAFFEDGKLRIEWTDRDGEGYAELDFSADFRSFDGFWASYDSPDGAPWNGVKQ